MIVFYECIHLYNLIISETPLLIHNAVQSYEQR